MPSTLAVAGSYGEAGFWRLDTPETRLTGPVRGCERGVMTRSRVIRRWLSLTGFAFAVAFYCASLTPSLLPRSPLFQGVVSGLTAVLGYALGATLGALARRLPWRIPPGVERITWRVALVLGPVLILLFLALGTRWQQDLRVRLDMSAGPDVRPPPARRRQHPDVRGVPAHRPRGAPRHPFAGPAARPVGSAAGGVRRGCARRRLPALRRRRELAVGQPGRRRQPDRVADQRADRRRRHGADVVPAFRQ